MHSLKDHSLLLDFLSFKNEKGLVIFQWLGKCQSGRGREMGDTARFIFETTHYKPFTSCRVLSSSGLSDILLVSFFSSSSSSSLSASSSS